MQQCLSTVLSTYDYIETTLKGFKHTLLLLLAPRCLIMYFSSSEDILGCNSGLLDTINDHKMNHRTPMLPEMRNNRQDYQNDLKTEQNEIKEFFPLVIQQINEKKSIRYIL